MASRAQALPPPARSGERPRVYLVAAALGVLLGLAAFAAGSASVLAAGVVAGAAALPLLVVGLGKARRFLLGLLILDIPFQWDVYLRYNETAGELGAIGGLNLSLTTIAVAGLYMEWAADWLGARGRVGSRLPGLVPLILYLLLNLLSIAVAQSPRLAAHYVALLVQMVLVFVYIAGRVRTRTDVTFVVVMLLVALLVEGLAIVGVRFLGLNLEVLGLAGGGDPSETPWWSQAGPRLEGTLGTPNTAAAYLAMLLPIAAGALATRFAPSVRVLATVALAVGSVGLILTFSRGGWLAAAVAFAVLLGAGAWSGLVSLRPLALALVVMLMVALPLYGAIGLRLTSYDQGAARGRVPLMELATRVVSDHPVLGVGANNFAAVLPDYAGPEFSRAWIYTVHNKYLLVAAETGLFALLAFLWFLLVTLKRGSSVWRKGEGWAAPIALGLTAALGGQLANMAVDLYNNRPQLQLLMVVCGLVIALSAMTSRAHA